MSTERAEFSRCVLIAMDGSTHADNAFKWYMEEIYRENDYVIIGYCPDFSTGLADAFERVLLANMPPPENELKAAQQKIEQIESALVAKLKAAKLKGSVQRLTSSNPGHALVKEAEKSKASMIVMGSRGLSTMRRTVMGSVSTYVLHHTSVPVLVYPHQQH